MPPPLPPRSLPDVDGGRFILGDAIEHRCQLVTIAEGGLTLRAAVPVAVGERVVAYLDRHGRVAGRVSATMGDAFTLRPTGVRQSLCRTPCGINDRSLPRDTQHGERIVPLQTRVLLRLPAGRRLLAQIVDLSRSGVALTCPQALAEGEAVLVGARRATVVRRVHRLHGLAFAEPLAEAEFGRDTEL